MGQRMNDQIIPVSFHGDTLVLAEQDGEPFVAMKPVVDNMGLDWKSQHTKLSEKFGSTMVEITIVAEDGKQRGMSCLSLRKFPAWLYSINPNKVKPELREKIVRYQEECDDVLWQYWTQGYVERTGAKRPTVSQQLSAHGVLMRLVDKLEAEHHPEKRGLLHQQVQHACRILGIEPPALDAIGHAEEVQTVPAMVETFWEAVELIGLEKLNHSRGGTLVAINLLHFARAAEEAKLRVPSVLDLRRLLRRSEAPRFVDANRPMNSALLGRTVRCWLFEPDQAEA